MSRKKRRRKAKDLNHPSVTSENEETSIPDKSDAADSPTDKDSQSQGSEAHHQAELDDALPTQGESDPRLPGFFVGALELPKDRAPWWLVLLLILGAYALSVHVRMSWIEMAMSEDRDSMRWQGGPTPNTHDSFYFAAILQKAHLGMHQENDLVPSYLQNGMITMFSYALLKVFPSLTIEQLLLWFPVYASGLVCVPVVLIGRLYGSAVWGFFAACIAGIAHSYFNRTLAGYYDTDVFSVSAAAFALMFLLCALRRRSLNYAFLGALGCFLYPLFYNRIGIPIAVGLAFVGFQLFQAISFSYHRTDKRVERWFHLSGYIIVCLYFSWFFGFQGVFGGKGGPLLAFLVVVLAVAAPILRWLREKADDTAIEEDERRSIIAFAWRSAILVGVGTATCVLSGGTKLEISMTPCFLILALLILLFVLFSKISLGERVLAGVGSVALVIWLISYNPLQAVFSTAETYTQAKQASSAAQTSSKKTYNLQFRNTLSTVREAGSIPWRTVLRRITEDFSVAPASSKAASNLLIPIAVLALLGYGLLVLRHWEFLLALPFIGIGLYAHWGGLRFTVHATAVAALGAGYLVLSIPWALAFLRRMTGGRLATWAIGAAGTAFFVLPNVDHAKTYSARINVVFPQGVIESLKTLEKKSAEGDFVVTWWDYGSGTWVYSGCRTFTSPAHHGERGPDNFLVSQVLRTKSQTQAANLARLMTEESIAIPQKNKSNNTFYRTAARSLFRDGSPDVKFYPKLFAEAESKDFALPPKTREAFLFLHYETLRIFGTVAGFSQRNLFVPEMQKKPRNINGLPLRSPFGMVLRDPKRQSDGVVFGNGSRLDAKGNLHLKLSNLSRQVPVSVIQTAGEARSSKQSLQLAGTEFSVPTAPRSFLQMVHAPNLDRVFLMDNAMRRSMLVRKYLLDDYNEEIVKDPAFEHFFSTNVGLERFYFLPTGYRQTGNKVSLTQTDSTGRTVNLSLDLAKLKATLPAGGVVPFSFHRVHYQSGKLRRDPIPPNPDAKYHAIQFTYPWETRDKGFVLLNTWLFLHDELFHSTVIQGFVFEDLDPELFEPVHLSPWAKIYRVKR